MGTRSITFIHNSVEDKDKKKPLDMPVLVATYRQFDGYPEGHGNDIAEFLTGFNLVNGLGSRTEGLAKVANGMGCFAAQFIREFKDTQGSDSKTKAGGFYVCAPDTETEHVDFTYRIYSVIGETPAGSPKVGSIRMWIDGVSPDAPMFDGTPEEFKAWLIKESDEADKA